MSAVVIDRLLYERGDATVSLAALGVLRRSLGVGGRTSRNNWGYRNRYVCGDDGAPPEVLQLVAAGLMEAVGPSHGCGDVYRATLAGAQLVGVSNKQVERLGLWNDGQ